MQRKDSNGVMIDRTDKAIWELKRSIMKKFRIIIVQALALAVLLVIIFVYFL